MGTLSEEQRIAAQRRFLAKRFGNTFAGETASTISSSTIPVSTAGQSTSSETDIKAQVSSQVKSEPNVIPVPSSSSFGGITSNDNTAMNTSLSTTTGYVSKNAAWPGPVIDTSVVDIHYDPNEFADEVRDREPQVRKVTSYSSQYEVADIRRIAACSDLISYAVAQHIRVISVQSSLKTLLKGHSDEVLDLEFSAAPGLPTGHFLLGSCAADGSVCLWTVMNTDAMPDQSVITEKEIRCVDSTRWTHPVQGEKYKRILFCSESPRFALIDAATDTVRVIASPTSVFTNGLKYEDVSLSGEHKPGTVVNDTVWISVRTMGTAGSDGRVIMWDVKSAKKLIEFVPHDGRSVQSIRVIERRRCLVTCDEAGQEIRLWLLMDGKHPKLKQRFSFRCSTPNFRLFNVLSVDPESDFLVLANISQKSLYVLHINKDLIKFDCVTELAVRQEIFSLCVTRSPQALVTLENESSPSELLIWCVQLKAIQLYHIDVGLVTPSKGAVPVLPSNKVMPVVKVEVKSEPQGDNPFEKEYGNHSAVVTDQARAEMKVESEFPTTDLVKQKQEASEELGLQQARDIHLDGSKSATALPESIKNAASDGASDSDLARAGAYIRSSVDEMLQDFKRTQAQEEVVIAKRVQNLGKSVESTLNEKIQATVDDIVQIKPSDCVDQAILSSTMMAAMNQAATTFKKQISMSKKSNSLDELVSNIGFEDLVSDSVNASHVLSAYKSACKAIAGQLTEALSSGVELRYLQICSPEIQRASTLASEIAESTRTFNDNLGSLILGLGNASIDARESAPREVDIREVIEDLLEREMTEEAFSHALKSGDSSLVLEVCKRTPDVESFFSKETLSQNIVLHLIEVLASMLPTDSELCFLWLNEAILVLEPDDASITQDLSQVLNSLYHSIETLQKTSASASTSKQCKLLLRIVRSMQH